MRLEGERVVISKLGVGPDDNVRVYSDAEIVALLEENKLIPETAQRVRALMRAGLV